MGTQPVVVVVREGSRFARLVGTAILVGGAYLIGKEHGREEGEETGRKRKR